MSRQEYHLSITADDKTAVELIHETCELTRGQIKQTMQKGAVWLEDDKGIRRLRRASVRANSV